jgi:hypothetical protein
MTNIQIIDHVPADDRDHRDHIATLLRRYPQIDAAETETLLDFLATGPIIEVGHLAGDPELKPIVERVRREHAKRFSVGIGRNLLIGLALVLPLVLFCWVAWDLGGK